MCTVNSYEPGSPSLMPAISNYCIQPVNSHCRYMRIACFPHSNKPEAIFAMNTAPQQANRTAIILTGPEVWDDWFANAQRLAENADI